MGWGFRLKVSDSHHGEKTPLVDLGNEEMESLGFRAKTVRLSVFFAWKARWIHPRIEDHFRAICSDFKWGNDGTKFWRLASWIKKPLAKEQTHHLVPTRMSASLTRLGQKTSSCWALSWRFTMFAFLHSHKVSFMVLVHDCAFFLC